MQRSAGEGLITLGAHFSVGFERRCSDSKLLHHRHQVPIRPSFDDLSVFDAEDGCSCDRGSAVGGRHAEELALVSAGDGPVNHNLVPLGDRIVDGELVIGEAVSAHGDVMFEVIDSGLEGWKDRVVVGAGVCNELSDLVELAQVPAVVDIPVDDLLVG
jgi:hypothetical protein